MSITVTALRANMSALRLMLGKGEFEFENHNGHATQLAKDHPLYNKFVPYKLNRIIFPPYMVCKQKKTGREFIVRAQADSMLYEVDMGNEIEFTEMDSYKTAQKIKAML